jgi:shikimate kinase
MNKNSIALIGFMGSGKTVAGKILAQRLNHKFIDVDKLIEKQCGKSIARIFAEDGEPVFRRYEIEAIKEASSSPSSVIACGGGAVLNSTNVDRIKMNATVVYLKASAGTLAARLSRERNRPLLKTGNKLATINALLSERAPIYEKAADIIIDTSNLNQESVADAIIAVLHRDAPGLF